MSQNDSDLCPSQFGKVELRVISKENGDSLPEFQTTYLRLENACFKWYDDREQNICLGVAYLLNKVDLSKASSSKEGNKKILRCHVSIKTGPATLELRLLHGSKLWQLAIDTHFSRCFQPLSQLPTYAYDLDDARYSSLHLSTTAKVSVNGIPPFDISISILDDVEEKVNILFPLSRTITADMRLQITAMLMKVQNQLVLEVLRRFHHLEIADQQLQHSLAKMTERAQVAEAHAESLHASILQIEEILPQLANHISEISMNQQHTEDKIMAAADDTINTQKNHHSPVSGGAAVSITGQKEIINWRMKYESCEQELQRVMDELHNCQRELRAQKHLPAFQSRIDSLTQENHLLREMTTTLRHEILTLNEQLQEIQQAALAQIETLHEQNPDLAKSAALSLRHMYDQEQQETEEELNISPKQHHQNEEKESAAVQIDLSSFLMKSNSNNSNKTPNATAMSKIHKTSPSIFRQPLDLDDLSELAASTEEDHHNHNGEFQHESKVNIESMVDNLHDEDDYSPHAPTGTVLPLLERDNWTNKYQDYVQQVQSNSTSTAAVNKSYSASSFGLLQENVTSLGWSFVEERFVMQLYQHYLHIGSINSSNGNTNVANNSSSAAANGMSLTKFQKFLKDFHILSIHTSSNNANSTDSKSAFTAAYVGGQPLPNKLKSSNNNNNHNNMASSSNPVSAGGLDKTLTHSDVSAIFTVASATKVHEDANLLQLTALWNQYYSQTSTGQQQSQQQQQPSAAPSKAAFKVHGGHRSAAEVLDFYHSQHVIYHNSNNNNCNSAIANGSISNTVATDAAFAVGHPGGVGVTVGVVNPASAVLSHAQFRYALTLIAEKLYSRILQQAMGGVVPQTLTGKDRHQATRAMLELLWVKNIMPIALSVDLVPQPLSCLRSFLAHLHSEATRFFEALLPFQQQAMTPMQWQSLVPELFAYFDQKYVQSTTQSSSLSQSPESPPSKYAMLVQLCYPPHLQSLCRLFRTFTSTSQSSMVREPLGMADVTQSLHGIDYLYHPSNHIPRMSMSFVQFRKFCVKQGLVPYLIGEHHVYALYQECVVMRQMYFSLFHQSQQMNTTNSKKNSKKGMSSSANMTMLRKYWQDKRVFPEVGLPVWMTYLIAAADKEVVYHQQHRASEVPAWQLSNNSTAINNNNNNNNTNSNINNNSGQHDSANPNKINMVTSGMDLVGFIIVLGALAMKVFPHMPPAARVAQLMSLLQQKSTSSRSPLAKSHSVFDMGDVDDGDVLVGHGYSFGGAFHHSS